jgi:hypothetical protein
MMKQNLILLYVNRAFYIFIQAVSRAPLKRVMDVSLLVRKLAFAKPLAKAKP